MEDGVFDLAGLGAVFGLLTLTLEFELECFPASVAALKQSLPFHGVNPLVVVRLYVH